MSVFMKNNLFCGGNHLLRSWSSPTRCSRVHYSFGASRRSLAKKTSPRSSAPTPVPTSSSRSSTLDLPVLIPACGESESEVVEFIRNAAAEARNSKRLHLNQQSYQNDASPPFRGYGLLRAGGSNFSIHVAPSPSSPPPVWLIFPGIGSQCSDMGKDLLKVRPFAESINRSKEIAASKFRVNVDTFFRPSEQLIFKYVYSSVLAITTVQIALFDTLKSLGLRPDGFIGHSTGELLCAYADGCLTAEETLVVADAQGRACQHIKNFGMANVPLSLHDLEQQLPPDVEIVGTNSPENVIVGGKYDSLARFLRTLKAEGKAPELIDSCGVSLHGTNAQESADLLTKFLKGKIDPERVRSPKWISSSAIFMEQEETVGAKFDPAEYFANNLRSPVRFYEALRKIPSGAIVIEVSPRGGLQKILRDCTQDCVNVPLMDMNVKDKLSHMYDAVGQIYVAGTDLDVMRLHPGMQETRDQPART